MSCVLKGVTPYIMSPDCQKHVEWLKKVFNAEQKEIGHFTKESKTTVMHCNLTINEGTLYLCDYNCMPEQKKEGPPQREYNGAMFQLEFANQKAADEVWKKLLDNGAKVTMELKAQFWGAYYGKAKDSFGYEWAICSPTDEKENKGVIPYIMSPDCQKHVEWLKKVFNAEQKEIGHFTKESKTTVMHCNLKINEGTLYLCDYTGICMPEKKEGPPQREYNGAMFQLEFANQKAADEVWKKLLDNGAKVTMELKAQFWGGYYGTAKDSFGYEWGICSPTDKTEAKE